MNDPKTRADAKQQIFGGIMEAMQAKAKYGLSKERRIEHHDYLLKIAKHKGLHLDAAALDCKWDLKEKD